MQHTRIHIHTTHAIWTEFNCYTCSIHMHSYMHIHHLISHICIFAPLFGLHVFASIFACMCMYECCMFVCMCMYVCILHACCAYQPTETLCCRKNMQYNKEKCTTYMHKHVTYIHKYGTDKCTYIQYDGTNTCTYIWIDLFVCMTIYDVNIYHKR
jgi:hypothetical protein